MRSQPTTRAERAARSADLFDALGHLKTPSKRISPYSVRCPSCGRQFTSYPFPEECPRCAADDRVISTVPMFEDFVEAKKRHGGATLAAAGCRCAACRARREKETA